MKSARTSIAIGFVCFVVAGLLPRPVSCQTTAQTTKSFSLQQAVNYALQHYPAVRAALEQVKFANADVSLARTQYLPSFSGVYQGSRATQNQVPGIWLPTGITPTVEGPVGGSSGQSHWGSQTAALFSWEPIDFGLRGSIVGQAQSAKNKTTADLAVTRLQVATAVANLFFTAALAHESVIAAQANVDRWQVFNQSVHTLVNNALRPGADASRADAQLAQAKMQLYQTQQAEQASLAMLASLMGTADSDIRLDLENLLQSPPTTSLPSMSPQTNPLAQDQMATVREVQAQEKILSKSDYPRIFLQAEGFARGSEVPNNGSSIGNWNGLAPARGNWIAGFTITFPNLFDFKARSAEEQMTKATENSQRDLYDKTIQDVTGQVKAALAQLSGARHIAQETPVELSAAQASESQSRARYQASLATIVEVATAEGLLAQAQMDDAVAKLNVWHGLFGVAYAEGDLQPFLDVLQGKHP